MSHHAIRPATAIQLRNETSGGPRTDAGAFDQRERRVNEADVPPADRLISPSQPPETGCSPEVC
jgi:hypothetical protein